MMAAEPQAPPDLKVLQVSAFFAAHGGGIEMVADRLASTLSTMGTPVHWMAGGSVHERPDAAAAPRLTVTAVPCIDPLERWAGLPAPLWAPSGWLALWRAAGRADVVHIHDYLYMPTLLAALCAALRGKPLVVTQHIGEIPFGSAFARRLLSALNRTLGAWVLGRAQQVVFVGKPVQDYFSRFVRLRRPARLIPNGVDHDRFHPAPRQPGSGPVRLLFVGRFVEKKGLPLLQQCLDLPGAEWTFVGWGPLPPLPASRPGVTMTGRLAPSAIAALMQQADLLVLPSTGEGFPLVLQEALACGTPVLVSREVADAFPVRDPRCVFDVELRTADPATALHAALSTLIANPEDLSRGREAAQNLARQWSWPQCASAYLAAYREVLAH